MRHKVTAASTAHQDHFETLFSADHDPWLVKVRRDEAHKRLTVAQALGAGRRGVGLEVGCGNGVTTALLARRFGTMIAIDASPSAVELTKSMIEHRRTIIVKVIALPCWFRPAAFDAVIASEILYYIPTRELQQTLMILSKALKPGGLFVVTQHIKRFADAECDPKRVLELAGPLLGPSRRTIVGSRWRCDVFKKIRGEASPRPRGTIPTPSR
jgi:SAM-dependent methyltransferase